MAVELCNTVGRAIGQTVNPMMLFDYPTMESLAAHVAKDMLGLEVPQDAIQEEIEKPTDKQQEEVVREEALVEVEGLSQEEMDAIVAHR